MKTVLVVDDQEENRNLLVKLLEIHRDFRVITGVDGADALEVTLREKPDLVIADVLMPRMDGFAFARKIMGEPSISHTRVIFLTGRYLEPQSLALAKACGVLSVVRKPAQAKDILQAVDSAFNSDSRTTSSPQGAKYFDEHHAQLVTKKLLEKVEELELLNLELESRVALRTDELASANVELRRLDRLKDQFLAVISHDLRTPLAGIQLGAQAMIAMEGKMSAKRRRDVLDQIAQSAGDEIALVTDLLSLFGRREGEPKARLQPVRLSAVARKSIDLVAIIAEAKGLTLDLEIEGEDDVILGDSTRLLHVFNNLLTNAIKFTAVGGVTVRIAPEPGRVRVQVIDTGMGMSEAEIGIIFSGNPALRRAGTNGEASTGLGLMIVCQILELHGGAIEVASGADGTRFTVFFPLDSLRPENPRMSGELRNFLWTSQASGNGGNL